jgi:murein DD-endopeptidase MepM/ murein hydrolase activator NlpD
MNNASLRFAGLSCLLVIAALGCQMFSQFPQGLGTPPNTEAVEAATAVLSTPSSLKTEQPQFLSTPQPGQTGGKTPQSPAPESEGEKQCDKGVCVREGHFLLKRPIGPNGRNNIVYTDRFGSYQQKTRRALNGVYFLNSSGTPVLAAADGEVVFAGNDQEVPQGPVRDMYGNLVIIQHRLPGVERPVYTLYAHLSEIAVETGEIVQAGQEIGAVGMSGNAAGSTLYFEVRLGENSYQNARNPELWLEPLPDESGQPQGALAGRVLDVKGNFLKITNIVLERLAGPGLPAIDQIYTRTYTDSRMQGLSPWKETFAAGDLPAGEYQISIWMDGMKQRVVKVQPGKLTVVTMTIK